MLKTKYFLIPLLFLVPIAANAQKRFIGFSKPGSLGRIIPDSQPPVIQLTTTTGILTMGTATRTIKTSPNQPKISIRGVIEDNQQVAGLKINGHKIPLTGTSSRKSFAVRLRQPKAGQFAKYELTAMDMSGNTVSQKYRLSHVSVSQPPVLSRLDSPSADIQTAQPDLQTLPKIWLYAIGVSEFQDYKLNLNYAASDAASVHGFFRSANGARLPMKQMTLLVNEAATRAKVIQSLTRTVKTASEEDLVIIFLASHGLLDADSGEINFLMHDTDVNNLLATGLSQSDLRNIIDHSRAKKVLFIVDACHSGELGTSNMVAARGIQFSEVNRLLTMLAKAKDGVAILSASSANEASFEGEQWNGGVFTYYLLSGLRGRADTNKDQIVTLRESLDYLYEKVPEATDGKQHPELDGHYSNDLPLVEVNP